MLCIRNYSSLIKQFKNLPAVLVVDRGTGPAPLSTVLKYDMHTVRLTDNVEIPALGYGTYRVIKKIDLI